MGWIKMEAVHEERRGSRDLWEFYNNIGYAEFKALVMCVWNLWSVSTHRRCSINNSCCYLDWKTRWLNVRHSFKGQWTFFCKGPDLPATKRLGVTTVHECSQTTLPLILEKKAVPGFANSRMSLLVAHRLVGRTSRGTVLMLCFQCMDVSFT